MALVQYGGGISAMSGSLGGNTFARNRGGNYVRTRTKPINPNTGLQQAIRSALSQLTTAWSQTLDADARTAWNLYASSVSMLNRLGTTIFLSGFNHFIRSNVPRLQAGQAIITAGPTTFELPQADPTLAIVATESDGKINVTFDNALDWAIGVGGTLYVYQGSPQNAQRNFFAGPWRFMDIVDGAVVPPTSPAEMDAVFAVTELQRQWVYARIGLLDGRLSEPFRADAFVTAGA